MDIVFNCPHCEQELAVDNSGAGSEIQCPACGEKILIPADATPPVPESAPQGASGMVLYQPPAIASLPPPPPRSKNMPRCRCAKSRESADASQTAVEGGGRGAVKKIRVRTIRHPNCIEAGHDKFDEKALGIFA